MLGLSVGILGASTFRRLFKEEVGKCARTDVSWFVLLVKCGIVAFCR